MCKKSQPTHPPTQPLPWKSREASHLFQNDDEEDEEEEGDDAEELLGKGARSAALLADRTRVSAARARVCVLLPLVITTCAALTVRVHD